MIGVTKPGVIWVCGLAGSGKTSFARYVVNCLQAMGAHVDHLDGDTFRKQHFPNLGYARPDRLVVALSLVSDAWACARSEKTCVVSTISLFDNVHAANAKNAAESDLPLARVLIVAPETTRSLRRAQLYLDPLQPMVGREIAAEYPTEVSYRMLNDGTLRQLQMAATQFAKNWQGGSV